MPHTEDALRLMENTCARLCHDLSGLIGTVMNAVEIAADDGASSGEALELAVTASTELAARLRLMRGAWGLADAPLPLGEFLELADGLAGTHPSSIDVSALSPDTVFSAEFGRLMLNIMMMADQSMPRGGTLTFSGDAADMTAGLSGLGAAWPAALGGCLFDPLTGLTGPWEVLAPVIGLLARRCRCRVTLIPNALGGAPAALRLQTA